MIEAVASRVPLTFHYSKRPGGETDEKTKPKTDINTVYQREAWKEVEGKKRENCRCPVHLWNREKFNPTARE